MYTTPKIEPEGICDECKEGLGFYVKGQKYCRICGMNKYLAAQNAPKWGRFWGLGEIFMCVECSLPAFIQYLALIWPQLRNLYLCWRFEGLRRKEIGA